MTWGEDEADRLAHVRRWVVVVPSWAGRGENGL
jgi:hypothetical protein